MKLCDDVITVFNARVDPMEGGEVWTPTVLRGCSWYATEAAVPDAARGGLVAADRVTVRIPLDALPAGRDYVEPAAYRAADCPEGCMTLQRGDVIVKGEVAGDGWTPPELKRAFAGCMTVLSVTDNGGPKALPE